MVVGIAPLLISAAGFAFTLWSSRATDGDHTGTGLDLTKVKDNNGVLSTKVSGCEIKVVEGRIEEYSHNSRVAVVLPCNEYFDDNCIGDTRSALGAYVNRSFEGQASAFSKLIKEECAKKLGASAMQQKTDDERGESFGSGRCLLLIEPLNRSVPIALVSTTTHEPGRDSLHEYPIFSMECSSWLHAWPTHVSTRWSCQSWERGMVELTHR